MAVEAHHLLLHAGGQNKLAAIHAGWEGGGGGGGISCEAAPASTAYASSAACYGRQLQGYQYQQSSCAGVMAAAPAPAPAPMMMVGQQQQYGQVCAASESGVTFGGAQEAAAAPRKRKRAEQPPQLVGLDAAGVAAAHLQQQLVDVDRLVLQHTAKMWAELTEQRRRHARQVAAAVEATAAKRLRAKDEEISRIGRLNWALEERVRTLFVEAQVWRDLAQSNEAAANALRAELQHALDAQSRRGDVPLAGDGAGAADDAESCCCGENDVAEAEVGTCAARAACTVCGEGAAEVLLLPCRHLCACAPCADAARACPACGGAKNGTVRVNFS